MKKLLSRPPPEVRPMGLVAKSETASHVRRPSPSSSLWHLRSRL